MHCLQYCSTTDIDTWHHHWNMVVSDNKQCHIIIRGPLKLEVILLFFFPCLTHLYLYTVIRGNSAYANKRTASFISPGLHVTTRSSQTLCMKQQSTQIFPKAIMWETWGSHGFLGLLTATRNQSTSVHEVTVCLGPPQWPSAQKCLWWQLSPVPSNEHQHH